MLALRKYARALVFVSIALSSGHGARAAIFEKLIMPGPVSEAHAKIEGECADCHDRSNRPRQTALCLDCHKDVAEDIRSKTRYHGRMPEAGAGECRGCHSEHHGRDADITRLNQAGFAHDLANFPLRDAHVALTCGSCHAADVPYRKTPNTCISCHNKVDAHHGSLGGDCAACHDAKSWQQTHFDHDKTPFPLTNKHAETTCAACHPGERYKGSPQECVGCHTPDDVHNGSQGKDCGNCHTTADWGTRKFDHARETGFTLLGRHAHVGCADCHRGGNLNDPIPKDCAGCHKSDDRHAGRLGSACGECHGNDLWRVTSYDHKQFFPLVGAHAGLDCHTCHTGVVKEQKLGKNCVGCHRADDPHGGSLGKACERCHSATKWGEINFDHDLTTYPLLGLHVAVTCGQCHANQHFNETPNNCDGCHANEDVHKGELGKGCGACHTPNGWKLWDFDHAARTRFPLSGAHTNIGCAVCHIKPLSTTKPSMVCGTCHAENDVHAGRFGPQCQECHTTSTFKRPRTN
jgi:hypothetical protein